MFCPTCGTELPDDGKTKYCVKCGAPLRGRGSGEHDDFPKSPGAGRAAAVILCLLLVIGGAAAGIWYFADHGFKIDMPERKTVVTAESAPESPDTNASVATQGSSGASETSSAADSKTAAQNERIDRKFGFTTPNGKATNVSVHFNKSAYDAYHALPRYYQPDEFIYYLDNTVNDDVLSVMTNAMTDLAVEQGYTNKELAYMAIRLVQSIKYVTDEEATGKEDYPKYPIETVYEMEGDCEDLSILLVGLLRKMGFETCFVVLTDHVGVGIRLDDAENGTYFEYEGVKYYYVETTAEGWNIGAYPEELRTDAHLYFVSKRKEPKK